MALNASLLGALPATAQSNKDHAKQADRDHGRQDEQNRSNRHHDKDASGNKWSHDPIVFNDHDRDSIRNYYRSNTSNLPPGLAKRNGNLPPGLRKQLRRNGTLPPGLQKRLVPLSGDVENGLRALPNGYSRGIIGQDVVIIQNRTRRIMDIIRDVAARS
jgi:hypothetical protein